MSTDIVCIGSVLWDVIGHSARTMNAGADVPGRISRHPGGVALNIAKALQDQGLNPALLSAVGHDPEGEELMARCASLGLQTRYIHRSRDLPTDRYMAIEDPTGLIAAIADAHSLEAVGASILEPLLNGQLGSAQQPYTGTAAVDGNLSTGLLRDIATSPLLAQADLRVAPASPGKADRLQCFLGHPSAILYVNLEEAGLICGTPFTSAETAGAGLLAIGANRALVTHGPHMACDASASGILTAQPPRVQARRVTGAGDVFMASHIASELSGHDRPAALSQALGAAATHVAGEQA